MITRSFDQGEKADSQNKNNVTERNRSQWSDCQTDSRYSKAADESCVYQKGILVQKKSSVIGGRRNFLTKMCLPPTARVSAEARDENERDAHDV